MHGVMTRPKMCDFSDGGPSYTFSNITAAKAVGIARKLTAEQLLLSQSPPAKLGGTPCWVNPLVS
jgi:hypothetical protein